jgi:hypothetical protein
VAILRKLLPLWLLCSALATQSVSGAPQGAESKPQSAQPSQTSPDSDKNSPPDQTPPAPPADSTKLEPVKIQKAVYPLQAREKQLQGQVIVKDSGL